MVDKGMLRFGAGRVYSAALGAPYERCQDRWGAIFGDMGGLSYGLKFHVEGHSDRQVLL
jgi:hypothetical protein